MGKLNAFLHRCAEGDLISWQNQLAAAERFHLSLAKVEESMLSMELLPARYQRNRQTITLAAL